MIEYRIVRNIDNNRFYVQQYGSNFIPFLKYWETTLIDGTRWFDSIQEAEEAIKSIDKKDEIVKYINIKK